MIKRILTTLLWAWTVIFVAAQTPDANALMREAVRSAQAGEMEVALNKMQAAVALRPAHPAYLYNLACLQSLAGRTDEALQTLATLAEFGVYTPAAKDSDFASLAVNKTFNSILAKFTTNLEPRGHAKKLGVLPQQSGLIEGIAVRATTKELFFGDMHQRCVWRWADGNVTRFTAADTRVFGIGGLAVDEARGLLWAACSAQPVMSGWSETVANHSALAAFDLSTGNVKHYYPVPVDGRPHATVDLALATNGTVYLSDSASPIIWRLLPDANELDVLIDDSRFRSLQGLVMSADDSTLLVADYALGLFGIDLATRDIASLATPPGATLIGIDGLARSGSRLIAVQNGVRPARILAIGLDAEQQPQDVQALAAALPDITDPTLGSVHDGHFIFIGDAGWRYFEPGQSPPPDGRAVPILDIDLGL